MSKIGKNDFSEEGGGCLIIAMATDACWVGHFCVEPSFFVLNHAFLCRTGLFLSNKCYIVD